MTGKGKETKKKQLNTNQKILIAIGSLFAFYLLSFEIFDFGEDLTLAFFVLLFFGLVFGIVFLVLTLLYKGAKNVSEIRSVKIKVEGKKGKVTLSNQSLKNGKKS
jgi:uncharacterized membrane protein